MVKYRIVKNTAYKGPPTYTVQRKWLWFWITDDFYDAEIDISFDCVFKTRYEAEQHIKEQNYIATSQIVFEGTIEDLKG